MRILGIDYGDARIGLAISDELGWTAQGLEVIQRRHLSDDMGRIAAVINQYNVEKIVLGFPKNMNGTIGPRGEITQEFASMLEREFRVPVILWDERLSTVAAERVLLQADMSRKKRKGVIDKVAAQMILQTYLDSHTGHKPLL
ncbi:Holliday junction resolvase RuvX [Fodinisporobacter ferrooxydans]|uniref:Putative pre-16S rRNA nuclease n=1 Tax=Fodinisporobacter ferrooxydans TaxID=2901836 RepID=A0ABY4CHG6_9BACL|nr:Holliday junction resolvase RuvX [Alicyclobacillaceae bacterium MYW30-H2]